MRGQNRFCINHKALDFLSSKVKENMQENASKASAQAPGPQIKAFKVKEGPDSAGGLPLNSLCGMLMKDYMGRSKY